MKLQAMHEVELVAGLDLGGADMVKHPWEEPEQDLNMNKSLTKMFLS
jgi:hypothetical protein